MLHQNYIKLKYYFTIKYYNLKYIESINQPHVTTNTKNMIVTVV